MIMIYDVLSIEKYIRVFMINMEYRNKKYL